MGSDGETAVPEQFDIVNIDGASDYYALLGVGTDADTETIETAYRDQAQDRHPDHSDAPDADRQFAQLQEARTVLGDDQRRWLYDHLGHDGYYRVTTQNDADLSVQREIVKQKIDKKDDYTPPVKSMGPSSEDDQQPTTTPTRKTVAIERAVAETLTELDATDGEDDTTDSRSDGQRTDSNAEQRSFHHRSEDEESTNVDGEKSSTSSETVPDRTRSDEAGSGDADDEADEGDPHRHSSPSTTHDDATTNESEMGTADGRSSSSTSTILKSLQNSGISGVLVPQDHETVADPEDRRTARTVTKYSREDIEPLSPAWDYWRSSNRTSETTEYSPWMYWSALWAIRVVAFVVLAGIASLVGVLGNRFMYLLAFLAMAAVGAGSAGWLTDKVTPGTLATGDPGRWRWLQSVGRILIGVGAFQALLAVSSPWEAFPSAVAGTLPTGVWHPPAVEPVITRAFVFVTVGCLVAGTVLVVSGLSWRLWIDRLAGGYSGSPTFFESLATGSGAVVAVMPLQLLQGSALAGALQVGMPSTVSAQFPGVAFLHVGFVVAVGVAFLPAAYSLWIARGARVAAIADEATRNSDDPDPNSETEAHPDDAG